MQHQQARIRSLKHEKTLEIILSALKCFKNREYDKLPDLLYNIRTSDLREMLPELGPGHRYYKTIMKILENDSLFNCQREALYNLAVILGSKENVEVLSKQALKIALKFVDSKDEQLVHHAAWCLFGIAASSEASRQECLDNDIIPVALKLMKHPNEKIQDLAGQIIYGMFHMLPLPTEEESEPLFANCAEILQSQNVPLKYLLWSLHFAIEKYPNKVREHNLTQYFLPHLKTTDSTVLIPLLILIAALFKLDLEIGDSINEFFQPLDHTELSVRIQACRTLADFVRKSQDIDVLISTGLLERLMKSAVNEETRVREQAVYAIVRCYGLGTLEQRKSVSNLGGTDAIVKFTVIANYPFNCNLVDCLTSLIDSDFQFFAPVLRDMNAVNTLYPLLSNKEPIVASRAANLIGYIGDSYKK